jgi:DUF1680 family protein
LTCADDPTNVYLDEHKLGPSYFQDQVPFVRQREAMGHAVRAQYLYTSVADLLTVQDNPQYDTAIKAIWEDATYRKQYITGGVGAREDGEAFDKAYVLPNDNAYAETCAAIANVLWNHKMYLYTGESQYMDVFERVLYNGFLGGMSVKGNEFFYVNPMSSNGVNDFGRGSGAVRHEWFGTACCPSNVSRFLPSMPAYIYAIKGNELVINLFADSETTLQLDQGRVKVDQDTRYPWEGNVKITVSPEKPSSFTVSIRVPGWAAGEAIPGGLYHYADKTARPASVLINGKKTETVIEKGYLKLNRAWKQGDVITLTLDMPVRQVLSNDKVKTNQRKVAIERGPILYCAEGHDNQGKALAVTIKPGQSFTPQFQKDMLGGISLLRSDAITLIPYYAWANRGPSEMTVWFDTAL